MLRKVRTASAQFNATKLRSLEQKDTKITKNLGGSHPLTGGCNSLGTVDRIARFKNPDAVWRISQAVCGILDPSLRQPRFRRQEAGYEVRWGKQTSADLTFKRLIEAVRDVHEQLRAQADRAINVSLTLRNWLIGAYIAEYELRGTDRASYGENLLNDEILSPSAELADYIDDFRNLAMLYQIVRNAFAAKTTFYGDVAKKTELLIREEAETYGIRQPSKLVEIDEKTLAAIKTSNSSDNNKVVNLVKGLVRAAAEKGNQEPYLIPISERAQAIMEAFEDSQESSIEALQQLEKLAKERIEARKNADDERAWARTRFTIYWELKREGVEDAQGSAKNLKAGLR